MRIVQIKQSYNLIHQSLCHVWVNTMLPEPNAVKMAEIRCFYGKSLQGRLNKILQSLLFLKIWIFKPEAAPIIEAADGEIANNQENEHRLVEHDTGSKKQHGKLDRQKDFLRVHLFPGLPKKRERDESCSANS